MIDRDFVDRLTRTSPVRLYASGVDGARVWWPWRMNKAGGKMGPASRRKHAAKCDHYVLDSNFGDGSITNRDVLDEAAGLGADAAVLADVYQDMEATVGALLDGLELADEHHYDGTLVLPLQPPHDECYRRIAPSVDRDVWWAVGGVKDESAARKIEASRSLRSVAGDSAFIHGLGFGATDRLARSIRNEPGLLDSIDNSTSMSNAVGDLSGTAEKMTVAAAEATTSRLRDLRSLTHFADEDESHEQSTLDDSKIRTDGGTDIGPADVARRDTEHDRAARRLRKSIPGPEPIRFPDGWTTSASWHRAQAAEATVGPTGPAEFSVLLGHPNTNDFGDRHRVIFAILDGQLVTRCDCDGWQYRGWCAHVAHLWWRWTQRDLSVVDLNTGRTWTSVPSWMRVDDRTVDDSRSLSRPHVAADGGGRS